MKDYYLLANTIIDRYANLLFEKNGTSSGAILCAISEVEGKIDDLKAIRDTIPSCKWFVRHRIEEQERVLAELKNMK